MAKKISMVNMKGGVGKSTLTAQLAYELAMNCKKVLVVDLDPQFNVSQYLLGATRYKSDILTNNFPTTWHIFEQNVHVPGYPPPKPLDPTSVLFHAKKYPYYSNSLIDLIPSRLELAFSIRNPSQKEYFLSQVVSAIESDYDVILIDCPPTESVFTTAAYLTSDYLLIPVKPEYLSSIGLPLLNNSLTEFESNTRKKAPKVAGVVFNFTSNYSPEEKRAKAEVAEECNNFGWYILKNEIPYSRSIAKSAREGKSLRGTSYSRITQVNKLSKVVNEVAGIVGL
ncbi:MAG: ParA family protein [Candidatus Bathyarchaeota archaeon]|nr:ParA family protein [Candidatus Bathyarchaeota archaeon]